MSIWLPAITVGIRSTKFSKDPTVHNQVIIKYNSCGFKTRHDLGWISLYYNEGAQIEMDMICFRNALWLFMYNSV